MPTQPDNISQEENAPTTKGELRYHEALDPFRDTVGKYYFEATVDVYRTVSSIPPVEEDFIPQKYRSQIKGISEEVITYTPEEIAELDEEDKREEVGHNALSVHKTASKSIKAAKRTYANVRDRFSPERAEQYKEERGKYVVRLRITPENGLLSKFHSGTGHANLLLRQNVNPLKLVDPDFEPLLIDYDENRHDSPE